MPLPQVHPSMPARCACGPSSAATAGLVTAWHAERRAGLRGAWGDLHAGRLSRFAACRPTVVMVARSATPAASGSFLRQGS